MVRQTISAQLATFKETPPELAAMLANDEIEVAYPILTQSEVLQDAQLIETIRNRTLEHQMAIAIRHTVPVVVSDALVETGDEDIIRTLLENSGARISQATMEYLVEESSRVNTFQEPIVRRHDLEPELAKRMFMWVSAALRKHIVENYDFDKSVVDDLLEKAALQGAGGDTHAEQPHSKSDDLVAELAEENAVTPDLLISALRNGQVHLFVSMFRQITELRHTLVARILLKPGGEGMAIACKAVSIGKDDFSLIFSLSRKVRPSSTEPLQEQTEEAKEFFDRISEVAARGVLRHWRRDTDYLAAIRQLELTSGHGEGKICYRVRKKVDHPAAPVAGRRPNRGSQKPPALAPEMGKGMTAFLFSNARTALALNCIAALLMAWVMRDIVAGGWLATWVSRHLRRQRRSLSPYPWPAHGG